MWHRYSHFKSPALKYKYNSIAKSCRHEIHNYLTNIEKSVIESNNLGKFFKMANKKFSTKSGIGVIRKPDGSVTNDDSVKSVLLNDYFGSLFSIDNNVLPPLDFTPNDNIECNNIVFNPSLILNVLKNLRPDSSKGPDDIEPIFLKKLAHELAFPMACLFENFFHTGFVPDSWRCANITAVFKKGDTSLVENYRPISLTSVCCKVMETVIRDQMTDFLINNGLISKQQHGFLRRHSTCSQLLECVHDWSISINNKQSVDVMYIDYSRAFDSVVHSKLLFKLKSYGIKYDLLNWIAAFLHGRKQRVVVNNHFSDFCNVSSGIAQGSVIGPLLFILFVNDLGFLFDSPVVCKLYADDVKLYSNITIDSSVPNPLQNAVDNLITWSNKWQLTINISKSNILHIGKNNPHFIYNINNIPLEPSDHVSDLGVTMDSGLSFDLHISHQTKKAYQRIAVLFKGFSSGDPKFLTLAYKVYVRPVLEYCSEVWSPFLLKHINAIENVQRHFTRRLANFKMYDYNTRLFILDLESLEERRIKKDLKMYYKIMNGLVSLDKQVFFKFSNNLFTRGHNCRLILPVGTCRYLNSFSNRVIKIWNLLPYETVNATSLGSFSARLNNFNFGSHLVGRALV